MRGRKTFQTLILVLGGALAGTSGQAATPGYSELVKEFDQAVELFMTQYRAADEESRSLMLADPDREPRHRFTPRFQVVAERHRGSPEAIPFLAWLVEHGSVVDLKIGGDAALRLLSDHLTDPGLAPGAKAIGRVADLRGPDITISELTRIIDGSPHRNVRAEALLRRGLIQRKEGLSEARTDLERAVQENPDSSAGKKAAETLAADAPLREGDRAPELQGRTLSGDAHSLSEFRGKVVLVDFWGMWCGPCVAKIPELKSLRERLKESPFDVLGINSDPDTDALRRFIDANGIGWINLLDGGTEGPLAKTWRLQQWPTSYLVDADGLIRACDPPLDTLETKIRALLKEE